MLEIKILGTPVAISEGRPVHFPYRKAEALFYYMAIEKVSNRERLAALLWCDEPQDKARRNLRQTLYTLKKSFPHLVFKTVGKSQIHFDPTVPCTLDLETLINEPGTSFAIQADDVFSGFFVNDAPLFEDWLDQTRVRLTDRLSRAFDQACVRALSSGEDATAERLAKQLIQLDPYNESGYQHLIGLYGRTKQIHRMQQTYDRVQQLFREELGITPSKELDRVFEIHLASRQSELAGSEFFFGRRDLLDQFEEVRRNFTGGSTKTVLFVSGPTGSGKTSLIREMTRRMRQPLIESHCYASESKQPYRAWHGVLKILFGQRRDHSLTPIQQQLVMTCFPGVLNPQSVPENAAMAIPTSGLDLVLLDLIEQLCAQHPIWFVIDDLQWMDEASLGLLSTLIHHGTPNIGLLLGSRTDACTLLSDCCRHPYFHPVPLEPFTFEETRDFVASHPINAAFTRGEVHLLQQASQGNPLLIHSGILLKRTHPEIEFGQMVYGELLRIRLGDLEPTDRRILEGLSLFPHSPDIDLLCRLLKMDPIDFFDRIEHLKDRQFLTEKVVRNAWHLEFTHELLREAVYQRLSVGKRRILHGQVADSIEARLSGKPEDRYHYPDLIHHFERSLDDRKALKYRILNLDVYYHYNHELYPVLKDGILEDAPAAIRQGDILETITSLERELDAVYHGAHDGEVLSLRILLDHMKGRYLIMEGQYEAGTACIERMLDRSSRLPKADYYILGCRQMVYCGIQNHDLELMSRYIGAGIAKARESAEPYDEAIFLRFSGLRHLLNHDFRAARVDLIASIDKIRTCPDRQYDLHEAAALNYLGEIERAQDHPDDAIAFYDQALLLYSRLGTTRGMAPILTNKALALYGQQAYTEALVEIQKACELFNQSETVWKQASATALHSWLKQQAGEISYDLTEHRHHVALAEQIGNPEEILFVKSLNPTP